MEKERDNNPFTVKDCNTIQRYRMPKHGYIFWHIQSNRIFAIMRNKEIMLNVLIQTKEMGHLSIY
jgi:hypothetical protein